MRNPIPIPGKQNKHDTVTVGITRKYSVRPYETLDILVSFTSEVSPTETQQEAFERVYNQVVESVSANCLELRDRAKSGEI